MSNYAYQKIADHYRTLIDNGTIRRWQKLPPIPHIAEEHGVSAETAAKAVRLLQAEGYVDASNQGTFALKGLYSAESPEAQKKIVDVLSSWQSTGFISPVWSVEFDTSDDCYITSFTLLSGHGPVPRHYVLNEVEMYAYVGAIVDWDPSAAGKEAVRLAREGWWPSA